MTDLLQRRLTKWLLRRGRRRLEREWQEYQHPPEVKYSLFRRMSREANSPQVFRSLIQINFYRQPR